MPLIKCNVCGSVTDTETNDTYFSKGSEAYDLEKMRKEITEKDNKITELNNKITELSNTVVIKKEDNEEDSEEERR